MILRLLISSNVENLIGSHGILHLHWSQGMKVLPGKEQHCDWLGIGFLIEWVAQYVLPQLTFFNVGDGCPVWNP